jgi:hypothetical protein
MGWNLQNITVDAGGSLAMFGPAAYLFLFAEPPSLRHVVYHQFAPADDPVDAMGEGAIHELYTIGDGSWHLNNLNAAAGDAPPAVSFPTAYVDGIQSEQHVLYIGSPFDGHVHELWWDGDWHHHDLMDGSGFPLALAEPRGYEYLPDSTQNIVYKGQDHHVHLLTNNGSGSNVWQHTDMTAKFGGPAPDGAPGAYVFGPQGSQHVNYRSADGHINEYWKDAIQWHHSDLTARSGAPAAVDDGQTGYGFRDQVTQHVNFASADGHIHELWWQASGWTHEDLTQHTGAPLISSGFHPIGYAFEAQARQPVATQHVLYTGQDDMIHELWWDPTGWHHNPIGATVGAPHSISSPSGFVAVADASQNVYYTSDAHEIIELRWTP